MVTTSTDNLKYFTLPWDTDYPWAEGIYELRAVAIDDDGNSNPDDALLVKIEINRTPPVVHYSGADFSGFIQSLVRPTTTTAPRGPRRSSAATPTRATLSSASTRRTPTFSR